MFTDFGAHPASSSVSILELKTEHLHSSLRSIMNGVLHKYSLISTE
jgi:hypothetical protein